jgi:hypothetical protein
LAEEDARRLFPRATFEFFTSSGTEKNDNQNPTTLERYVFYKENNQKELDKKGKKRKEKRTKTSNKKSISKYIFLTKLKIFHS